MSCSVWIVPSKPVRRRRAGSSPRPAGIKIQHDISSRHGVEPEIAARRFAADLRIQDFHGNFIHLQVSAGLHPLATFFRRWVEAR
jgi:hypothetical protein